MGVIKSVNAVVCWKYHSLDKINSSIFLNLLRKYRTAGHLVFLQPWPAAGRLDTAYNKSHYSSLYTRESFPSNSNTLSKLNSNSIDSGI